MFIKSLKLSWIRKVDRSEHNWKYILLQNCHQWNCIHEHGPEYVEHFPKYNKFWVDVLESYRAFYYKCIPKNASELLAEPICYNKRLQIGKQYIVSNKLKNKEVLYRRHFFSETGQILSHTMFNERYKVLITI